MTYVTIQVFFEKTWFLNAITYETIIRPRGPLVVKEYDEALKFYIDTLGFQLIEDTYISAQDKRWVVIEPPGSTGAQLLLARAVGEEQSSRIGNQTGGRVFLFPIHRRFLA